MVLMLAILLSNRVWSGLVFGMLFLEEATFSSSIDMTINKKLFTIA